MNNENVDITFDSEMYYKMSKQALEYIYDLLIDGDTIRYSFDLELPF